MSDPGVIRNRERVQQIRSFAGMRFGAISPTDIDGFFEIRDHVFVFIETKYGDSPLTTGQRKAFERLTDAIEPPRWALFVVARHDQQLPHDIDVASCAVTRYRWKAQWRTPGREVTVRELVERFIKKAGEA